MAASTSISTSIQGSISLKKVKVETKGGIYDVVVGRDICSSSSVFKDLVQDACSASKQNVTKFFLFVDSNLLGINSGLVTNVEVALASLVGADKVNLYCIKSGEASKCRDQKAEIEDWLSQNGADRRAVFVALGGGVIGDLIGFVAASYYRGVRFIQIPTTVLSMVDSSVGGKTAVDTDYGKNLIGAFWQPILVVADISTLNTLPMRQVRSGIAEIIKAGMCARPELFSELESLLSAKGVEGVFRDPDTMGNLIVAAIDYKRSVVEEDERDKGLRNELNWGHTVGHAIEGMGVTGLHHGECVSIGMVYESMALRALGQLSNIAVQRLEKVLKCSDLPTVLPPGAVEHQDELMRRMKRDKKNRGGAIHVVNVKDIGRCEGDSRTIAVPERLLKRVLASAVSIDPSGIVSGKQLGPSVIQLPGSKSISNRALVLAALADKPEGKCQVLNLTPSEDVRVMLGALAKLGVDVNYVGDGPDSGLNVELVCPKSELFLTPDSSSSNVTTIWVENAGTVARFITPVLAYLVATSKDASAIVVIDGNERMRVRPVRDLVDCVQKAFKGVKVEYQGTEGCLPLKITKTRKRSAADDQAGFPCGTVGLSSKVSSQFVSGMLLISSMAKGGNSKEDGFTLLLEDTHGGKAVSQPYIDMTCRVMEAFGVKAVQHVDKDGRISYRISSNQKLIAPSQYFVEADASAASYPLAIAAATGCKITVNLPYQDAGSQPLQGDAHFVSRILEPMGCKVEKSKGGWTTVTGPPGGELKAIGSIDMSDMTDAFLTAAVLMALAKGESAITNVANQRVKECDRIAAMAQNINLCFCAKVAEERPDGLVIHGGPPPTTVERVTTDSHDDHRVAMSIAVLATRFPAGAICIGEPRCVEKTFSDFWDVLELQLGIPVSAAAAAAESRLSDGCNGADVVMSNEEIKENSFAPRRIFLIGMRNCGKTSIGKSLAAAIGWKFLDMDAELEQQLGVTVTDYVKKEGWKEFRRVELELLHSILENESPERTIVSCGGGIVEIPRAVTVLAQQPYVVWLRMEEKDVVAANTGPDGKPAYGEPVEVVYGRRRDKFLEASKFEVALPPRPANPQAVPGHIASCRSMAVRVLQAWINRLDSLDANGRPALPAKYSTFTCLTLESYAHADPSIGEMAGTSAVEVRVDLLKEPMEAVRQLQYASSFTGELPIIATVRSASEGGKFNESDTRYWDLVDQMSRSCCVSYIDIEISRTSEALFPKPVTGVGYIASQHFLRPPTGGRLEVNRAFDEVLQPWWSAVGKVVYTASSEADASLVLAAQAEKLREISKPSIGLCMGPRGAISRIMNPYWTPVRHPAMAAAAPGQLSLQELCNVRQTLHIGTAGQAKAAKRYYVFGSPVTKSPSPALHNYIFKTFGLPHEYSRYETKSLEDVLSVMAQDDFGGASITIPLKEKVFAAVSGGAHGKITELALSAHAVNTIVKHDDGSFSFHNTDTLALAESIRNKAALASTCLVVGTGGAARGACAAAELLGMDKIYVWGRDEKKAASLAKDFENGQVCPSKPTSVGFDVIIGCVPANDSQSWPKWWFARDTLILEMAYIPQRTPLTMAGEELGCHNIVYGLEILVLQGIEQSMLWTGMPRESFGDDVYGPVVQFYTQTNSS